MISNSTDYIALAKVTEPTSDSQMGHIADRLDTNQRLVHAGMGLTTEVAELVDALKKTVFYGKPLDKVNLKEEAGDILWYLAIVADVCGFTFEECMTINIDKLRARFGDKFTEHAALNRDLNTERKILETPACDHVWVAAQETPNNAWCALCHMKAPDGKE